MNEARKSLVTGATGFIGKRLVERLIARGDNVTCLVRPTSNVADLQRLDCSLKYGDVVERADSVISMYEIF